MARRFIVKFHVPSFGDTELARTVDYWDRRRVKFKPSSDNRLEGTRGSLWGNASSFDMSNLKSTISITKTPAGEIVCQLSVSTALQIITPWDEARVQLELENFRHYILYDDERPHLWQQFQAYYRKHVLQWTLTGGFSYHHLPDEVRTWLTSLSAPETSLPIADAAPIPGHDTLPVVRSAADDHQEEA